MKKNFILLLLAGTLLVSLVACDVVGAAVTSKDEITTIYVYHSGFGIHYLEYKIDLKNAKLWDYHTSISAENVPRDKSAQNEGFSFVQELEQTKIDAFRKQATEHRFTKWKESYIDYEMGCGNQWGITIVFANGATKEIYGSNDYPKKWGKMGDALRDLTGEDVLLLELIKSN
ncbi:MAG: hypothetical protein LBN05_07750 [Oscillospiraceae bacterium]|jgi:hypothetical protein|nr:hypothetical protein [Oscillospiraceae bacterium]